MNQNFAMRSCLGGFGENFQVRNFTVDGKGGRSMGLGAGSTNNSDTEDNSELVQQNPDQGEKADDPIYQRVTNNDQLQDMLLKYGYTFDIVVEGDPIMADYAVSGTPTTILLNREHKIVGYSGTSDPNDPFLEAAVQKLVAKPVAAQ